MQKGRGKRWKYRTMVRERVCERVREIAFGMCRVRVRETQRDIDMQIDG